MGTRRWWHIVCCVTVITVLGVGCNSFQNTGIPMQVNCQAGAHVWLCTLKPTSCTMANTIPVCGADEATAAAAANLAAIQAFKLQAPPEGTTCTVTEQTAYIPPRIMPQGEPSCIVTTDDDSCQTCAKSSCCTQYVACFADVNCSCLVGCLYDGIPAATCTSMDNCGSPSAVSIATASCLGASCSAACVTMGGMMATTSTCEGAGGGGSSGTGTSCTPGIFGAGETCGSNGDCESCLCNAQSQTCD